MDLFALCSVRATVAQDIIREPCTVLRQMAPNYQMRNVERNRAPREPVKTLSPVGATGLKDLGHR